MLTLDNITYRIAGRPLIDGASAQIADGERVAVVGRNGTGKSTLFRLITGEIHPDGGDIVFGANQRIGTVAQEAPGGETPLIDVVLAADKERSSLLAEAETATDPHRIGEIHTRLADIGAHAAPARASQILTGLGFKDEDLERPVGSFSGGWRMRAALAAVLFSEPDILLLDEPTNHLDLEATLWLEKYLANYPYSLVIVSHDRALLNSIPKRILHLENGKLVSYTGNYDRFEHARAERNARLDAMRTKQMEQRRHIQQFVDRFRYKASKARQAQSRLKMLEKMQPIEAVVDESAITFRFPKPDILPPPILTLEEVRLGYGEVQILSRLNLRIDMDDRIAMLGQNGNGKTTLLRALADRLKPLDGRVRHSSKLKVGYFAQNQAEELDLKATPLEAMQKLEPLATEEKLRSHLGRFGFSQDKADVKIENLSGGEKARLALATICLDAPHLLLLDEPTNHLDIDSRQALIQALADYEGAVILVSHDPHLVSLTADRLWLVADGTCKVFDGDMEDYKKLLLDQRRARQASARSTEEGQETDRGPSRKEERQARAKAREALAPLRKKAKKAEELIEKLSKLRDELHDKLADPTLYEKSPQDVTALNIRLADVTGGIEAAELEWMETMEKLEALDEEAL